MRPIVHEQGDRFDDRNLFLQATLGLVAVATRFRALAVRHGNVPRTPSGRPADAAEEPALDLLLGFAAVAERALSILERVREECEETPVEPRPGEEAREATASERATRVRRLLG